MRTCRGPSHSSPVVRWRGAGSAASDGSSRCSRPSSRRSRRSACSTPRDVPGAAAHADRRAEAAGAAGVRDAGAGTRPRSAGGGRGGANQRRRPRADPSGPRGRACRTWRAHGRAHVRRRALAVHASRTASARPRPPARDVLRDEGTRRDTIRTPGCCARYRAGGNAFGDHTVTATATRLIPRSARRSARWELLSTAQRVEAPTGSTDALPATSTVESSHA